MPESPKPFVPHENGALLHGTKADLAVGDLLVPGLPGSLTVTAHGHAVLDRHRGRG